MKEYGFRIGSKTVDIKEDNEQLALKALIVGYWELIDKAGKIELLGELQTNKH